MNSNQDWILKVLEHQIYALGKFNSESTPDPRIGEVLLETIQMYLSLTLRQAFGRIRLANLRYVSE